ncbi:MAG: hypothetical protein PHW60_09530 [Kiritimatiellae bacterium]|nr:hypothetical protein [Kiritimatiellia bacterium]
MLRKTALFVEFCIFFGHLLVLNAAPNALCLDGEWDFTFKKELINDTPALPDASAYDITLNVPDYWCFQSERFAEAAWWPASGYQGVPQYINLWGTGFYRKQVAVPADWSGKSVQLLIARAHGSVNIWFNGTHAGYYPFAGLFPSCADLSLLLKPGKTNEIIISVSNMKRLTHLDRLGGIEASVFLKVSTGSGRIDGLFIREGGDAKEVVWEADLKFPFEEKERDDSTLQWKIKAIPSDTVVGEGSVAVTPFSAQTRIEWISRHDDIKAWHPNSPTLYMAELAWHTRAGALIDMCKQRFGLRVWHTEGRQLMLNGKPIYLRQMMALHHESPHYRYPMTKDYWVKFFKLVKDAGYNSIEQGWTSSADALEAADEVGIVMQTAASTMLAERQAMGKVLRVPGLWEGIARWTRTYPSLAIYCFGGEMNYYDGFIEDVGNVARVIKSINPRCLILPNHAMKGIDYVFDPKDVPALTRRPFPHHAKRLEEITRYSDIFGHFHAPAIFSYHNFRGSWAAYDQELAVYNRPLIAHEVVMMSQSIAPYPADGQFNTLRYGRKDVAHLLVGTYTPVTLEKASKDSRRALRYEVTSRLHELGTKYVLEKVRKCGNLAGYEHIVGSLSWLYDQYLELRPGYSLQKMLRYNNDNVLLLDFDEGNCYKRCYWEGDTFQGKIMVSLYQDAPILEGTLMWTLNDGQAVLMQKTLKTGSVPNGKVTTLADMEFTWPEVRTNSKVDLAVTLSAVGREIRNNWEFWVFKKNPPGPLQAGCAPESFAMLHERYPGIACLKGDETDSARKLWIVEALTAKELDHLEAGNDILLLGASPFPVYSRYTSFVPGRDIDDNHGSIVHPHPIFARIPHEGWGDWQFYAFIHGAAGICFDQMKDIPFDPLLEVVSAYRDRKRGLLFEFKAAKGRLFVAAGKFHADNPACMTLLDSILEHMAGPGFKPATAINLDSLKRLISAATVTFGKNEIIFTTNAFHGGAPYAKSGVQGLMLTSQQAITAFFNLKQADIPAAAGNYLTLAVEGIDCDQEESTLVKITLNGHLVIEDGNQWSKSKGSIWNIPFDKSWLGEGGNKLEICNADVVRTYNKWFIVAGAAIGARAADRQEKAAGAEDGWTNRPVTVAFTANQWHKLNQGSWQQGGTRLIDTEGRHTIHVKDREDAEIIKTIEVRIDATPPVLALLSAPVIEQLGGEYFGKKETVFKISAKDNLSGVKKTEVSIDLGEYRPYTGPFSLPSGLHSITCRCIDQAGNQQAVFAGGLEGGGPTDVVHVQIK